MQLRDRLILFSSTGGYVGKMPLAPGTAGSLWGIPICYIIVKAGSAEAFFLTILFIAAAVWIAGKAEELFGRKDANPIVIDEIAGYMVTLLGLPFNPTTVIAGFFLFRGLDILKPFPIRWLERRMPGGFGVVLDDVAAGIYGNLLLRVFFNAG
jgi:phosphatidylglycerophosphatase A